MFTEQLLSFFAWCTLLNFSVLITWLFIFKLGHDWLHLLHRKWFDLNEQQFDLINYCGMGLFKLLILVFNLAPWIALQLIE